MSALGEVRRIIVDSLFDDPPVLLEIDAAGAGHVAQVMEDDYERTGNPVSLQIAQVVRAGLGPCQARPGGDRVLWQEG